MPCIPRTAFLLLFLLPNMLLAEDADDVREKGIAALKESQTNPRAIVEAARLFVKAAALYNDAGNEEKNVELNSFLYWCKKKMTMEDIDAFIKGGESAVAGKLTSVEKLAPEIDDAQKWFDRADQFAANNVNEHLLIAIRFYEVADRFKGAPASLQAQDRSLKEMLLDKNNPGKMAALPAATRSADPPTNTIDKRPVPSADDLKNSEKVIKELFKADYAKSDALGRYALVAKLLQQAEENKSNAAVEYVLLEEIRDLSVMNGNAEQAVAAEKRLCDSFKIDRATILLELKKLEPSAKTPESAAALANVLMQGAEDALSAADYEHAVRYASRAEDLQTYVKDAALKVRIKGVFATMQTIKRESIAALAAQKTLEAKPDDPDANLTAGKFALTLGNFEKSLPLLVKGRDTVLSGLAKLELTPPTAAAEQAQLADGWFERAEKEAIVFLKKNMQERASFWYRSALPGLVGLSKLKAEARLKLLPQVAPAGGAKATPPAAPAGIPGRHIVFNLLLDAADDLIMQKGLLRLEHRRFSKPKNITINGTKWEPVWTEDRTDDFTGFDPPLIHFGEGPVTLKILKGRAQAKIAQQPTIANKGTLIVNLNDSANGAAELELVLSW